MNYQKTIDYLFSQLPMYQRLGQAAYKNNLDNTLALDSHLGHPHRSFKTIHVAGTNGKGSVSHMLASILQESGLKTGLYTSPHLYDFRERIKINGEWIPESEVVEFVDLNKIILDKIKPSFFEMTVAMAFNYFAKQEVDVAVIEVGMGGRLDSTNIITPVVSIITNIGYDHMAFLGSTLKQIATEKAGIIKEGVPVIIGEYNKETSSVFIEKTSKLDTFICFSERRFFVRDLKNGESGKQELAIRNEQSGTTYNVSLDLNGDYQKKNVIPVFGALQILVPLFNLPKDAIISGMSKVVSNTGLSGRYQIIQEKPKVICDTGHNKEGLSLVFEQITQEHFNKLHVVFGTVSDKDIESILSLLPKDAQYYFTQAKIPRAFDYIKLKEIALSFNLKGEGFSTVKEAYASAIKNAAPNDLIFIGGSTFVVSDFLQSIL